MFSLKVEGGDELAAALNRLPARLSRSVKIDALMDGGEPIRRMASQIAPRAPGAPDWAANIHMRAIQRPPGEDPRVVSVGIGVPKRFFYDWFNEFGTVKQGAQPTYRPAFDTHVPTSLGIIGRALWTALAARGIGRSGSAPSPVQSGGRLL